MTVLNDTENAKLGGANGIGLVWSVVSLVSFPYLLTDYVS